MVDKDNVLYRKVGKRYKPVQKHDAWEYFMKGFYLIHIDDNSRSAYSRVFPENLRLQSAYRIKQKKIADVIRDGLKMHPAKKTVTKKQKAAWLAFEEAMGKDKYCVEFRSIQEIIDNIEKVIMED